MNNNRQYAEGLLGPRDTSYLDTNRHVAGDIYKTNWGTLQNQFENLKNRLVQAREESKKAYGTGLGQVAEGSFDSMNAGTANLISRGVGNSGLADRLVQIDTQAKGEGVNRLLDVLGNTMVQNAEGLSNANTQVAGKERELMGGLSDTLGEIGQRDLSGQMNYNQAASNIAGSKEGRDMENALAARQRAINERSINKSATTPEEDELEELYKKMAINEVLSNGELDDKTKANILTIMFEKGNADVIIDAYNRNLTTEGKYNKSVKDQSKLVEDAKKKLQQSEIVKKRLENGNIYNNGFKPGNAFEDKLGLPALGARNFENKTMEQAMADVEENQKWVNAHQNLLDNIKKNGITYRDLAKLLYGN